MGRIYKKLIDKRHDAKRIKQQSAKGNLWSKEHPDYNAARMRNTRAKYGREPRFMIRQAFSPITVIADEVIVASDWHIPFQDSRFCMSMIETAKARGISKIIIPGDFWDCDNYKMFVHKASSYRQTFKEECENVRTWLKLLTENFDEIYFCRGNHENRWLNINAGNMDMDDMFTLTKIVNGYKVTTDDHIILKSQGHEWLICHPKNFRQIQLSVGRDLAAKYLMNIFVAHGHQFAQGQDRSGTYKIVDGGGMFDAAALEYLRTTTTCPAVQGGYYILHGDTYEAFRNEAGASTLDRKKGR